MHNLETAYKLYNQMMNENPDYANKLVKQWSKLMPNEFAKVIYCDRYGKHIVNREQYELGLSFIEGQNGKAPEIWSIEEAKKILSSYIRDYEQEDFYNYDAFLWLNVKRNDYPKLNESEIAYITYQDLKNDADLPYDPSERAYEWVEEHLENERK